MDHFQFHRKISYDSLWLIFYLITILFRNKQVSFSSKYTSLLCTLLFAIEIGGKVAKSVKTRSLRIFAFYDQFWNTRLESFNDRYLISFEKKGKSNNRNLIRNKHSSDMFILEQYFNWTQLKRKNWFDGESFFRLFFLWNEKRAIERVAISLIHEDIIFIIYLQERPTYRVSVEKLGERWSPNTACNNLYCVPFLSCFFPVFSAFNPIDAPRVHRLNIFFWNV